MSFVAKSREALGALPGQSETRIARMKDWSHLVLSSDSQLFFRRVTPRVFHSAASKVSTDQTAWLRLEAAEQSILSR
jgi:hypothetical protein